MSHISERLSPVKLPYLDGSSPSRLDDSEGLSPAKYLEKHPHGISAKHNARRYTIHKDHFTPDRITHPGRTVHTVNHVSVTSPRIQELKKTIESMHRRSVKVAHIDSSPTNKENIYKRVSSDSSPLKRVRPDKIQRVTTNANDSSVEVRNSEVYLRHVDDSSDDDVAPLEPTTFRKLESEHTQISKIVHEQQDYVTPQRPTEPVARSPDTNQQMRVLEKAQESTSPLKDHDDDEPTLNFLMSPNSKPFFSVAYLKSVQEKHDAEMLELEKTIESKNKLILSLSEELAATNEQFLSHEKQIKELKQLNNRMVANEEMLTIQLHQTDRELASLTKKYKLKETALLKMEATLATASAKVRELTESVSGLHDKNAALSEELTHTQNKLQEHEFALDNSQFKLKGLQDEVDSKDHEIASLNESNLAYNEKVEVLLKEKEELIKENGRLIVKAQELEEELQRASEQSRSVDELKAQVAAKDEELTQTKQRLEAAKEEARMRKEDFQKFNKEYESLNLQLLADERVQTELKQQVSDLQKQLDERSDSTSDLKHKIASLDSEKIELAAQLSHTEDELAKVQRASANKDDIITSDTKTIDRLQKELSQVRAAPQGHGELLEEIAELKQQVASAQEKTDARIRDVAEQLYFQYSKKHEKKIALLKDTYKAQLEEKVAELKDRQRDNDSLERKLRAAETEVQRLLAHLDKQSPKRVLSAGRRR